MSGYLRYDEQDDKGFPTGRALAFSDVEFKPLGYGQLQEAKLSKPVTVPLSGTGRVNMTRGVEHTQPEASGHFRTTVESEFASQAIGLVRGGWLPSALALQAGMIVFPDRCVVAKLKERLANGQRRAGLEKDFIDLFADTPVRINPLLFALEGDARRNPTANEVVTNLEEAILKIKAALPQAELIAANYAGVRGALGLIADEGDTMEREQDFLMRVHKIAGAPVGRSQLPARWHEILSAADDHNIPRLSFVVLSVLSAIATPNGKGPCKRLLKLGGSYSRGKAYNALSDLRSIGIMTKIFALFPDQPTMLCTADRDLALFWVGVRAHNFKFSGGRVSYDIEPSALLPGLPDDLWDALIGR